MRGKSRGNLNPIGPLFLTPKGRPPPNSCEKVGPPVDLEPGGKAVVEHGLELRVRRRADLIGQEADRTHTGDEHVLSLLRWAAIADKNATT